MQIYCGNGFTVLSKIDKKMKKINFKRSSQETSGTSSINIIAKDFKKVGDVEMNQIENVLDYTANVQDTHKQLVKKEQL